MAIYMNFNNKKIKGNVTAAGYEDWIELDSFSLGTGRGITMEVGNMANREASRPSISEVSVTKMMDNASGGLFKESLTGVEGVVVQIHIVQTGAKQVEKFAAYELTDVLISSYSVSASGGISLSRWGHEGDGAGRAQRRHRRKWTLHKRDYRLAKSTTATPAAPASTDPTATAVTTASEIRAQSVYRVHLLHALNCCAHHHAVRRPPEGC